MELAINMDEDQIKIWLETKGLNTLESTPWSLYNHHLGCVEALELKVSRPAPVAQTMLYSGTQIYFWGDICWDPQSLGWVSV